MLMIPKVTRKKLKTILMKPIKDIKQDIIPFTTKNNHKNKFIANEKYINKYLK